jgi:DNA-binding phage protein
MSATANHSGLDGIRLDVTLSKDEALEFSTVMRVIQSLGLRLSVAPVETPKAPGL